MRVDGDLSCVPPSEWYIDGRPLSLGSAQVDCTLVEALVSSVRNDALAQCWRWAVENRHADVVRALTKYLPVRAVVNRLAGPFASGC
mmetsp:Transcript_29040/g.58507  ORF Transcript_29040/g.58507 Transcript_29040/m.58507 type:complete len:87 (+) Transcript_29040:1474-1734(+)